MVSYIAIQRMIAPQRAVPSRGARFLLVTSILTASPPSPSATTEEILLEQGSVTRTLAGQAGVQTPFLPWASTGAVP